MELQRTEMESGDRFDDCHEFSKNFLPTLPPTFESLLGKSISIESEQPQQIIELLGGMLGITDYQINKISFWFLDTLAHQVLRHKKNLGEYYTTVLISWLTGEIKLIRDRRCLREEFFAEVTDIFIGAVNKISEKQRLLFWDEIVFVDAEEVMENLSPPNQSRESLQNAFSQDTVKSNGGDPISVLDIVIECTYDMYASELRYALIYAVFVERVEVQVYNLPFTLRMPRPVQFAQPKTEAMTAKLSRKLKKLDGTAKPKGSIEKIKGKEKLKSSFEPPTLLNSMDDEKLLFHNRVFILPLIQAQEASGILEAHTM